MIPVPGNSSFLARTERLLFGDWAPARRMPYVLAVAGVLLTLSYAFMKVSFYREFKILEPALILLSAYAFFRYGGILRRSFPVMILAASVGVALISWVAVRMAHPELAADTPSPFALARGFAFIFLAFWLAANPERGLVFWGFATAGLLVAPWAAGEGFQEILGAWDGRRVYFGLQNAQHSGMLFGIVALGMVAFFKRMVLPDWRVMPFRLIGWVLAFGFIIFAVFASQARAVVVAAIILMILSTVVVVGILFFWVMKGVRPGLNSAKMVGLGAFFLLVAIVVSVGILQTHSGVAPERNLASATLTIENFLAGTLEEVERNATAERLVSWQAALEWSRERPVFGWGHSGGAIVMQKTEWLPEGRLRAWGHVHSTYLELLVRYGLLGISLYVALSIWVGWHSYRAFCSGSMPLDFLAFFIAFFVFWAIVNAFESYMFYWTGVYAFNVVMAVLLGFIWREQENKEEFPGARIDRRGDRLIVEMTNLRTSDCGHHR